LRKLVSVAAVAVALSSSAWAAETVSYTYDALGRLTVVSHSGTVNSGVQSTTSFDAADNRTNYTVTGVSGGVLSVADASASEGSPVIFTVSRAGPAASAVAVSYATSNGTAAAGSDYTATSGTLNFASGETTKTISVPTTSDGVAEGNETFSLTLSSPTGGATLGTASATGTIVDANSISFSIGNAATVTEGGTLVFTVTKTGSTTQTTSVNFATANGTATAGSDYTATSGTLTFAPGDTSKTINVATIDDTAQESTESLVVNLSGASGGTIGTAQGTGSITDNDSGTGTSQVTIDDRSATPPGTVIKFNLKITPAATTAQTINYATADGTGATGGVAGSDYVAKTGVVSLSAGQGAATISIQTIAGSKPTYSFFVNLSNPSSGLTLTDTQAVGTITAN
jgi:hypothetical protein